MDMLRLRIGTLTQPWEGIRVEHQEGTINSIGLFLPLLPLRRTALRRRHTSITRTLGTNLLLRLQVLSRRHRMLILRPRLILLHLRRHSINTNKRPLHLIILRLPRRTLLMPLPLNINTSLRLPSIPLRLPHTRTTRAGLRRHPLPNLPTIRTIPILLRTINTGLHHRTLSTKRPDTLRRSITRTDRRRRNINNQSNTRPITPNTPLRPHPVLSLVRPRPLASRFLSLWL